MVSEATSWKQYDGTSGSEVSPCLHGNSDAGRVSRTRSASRASHSAVEFLPLDASFWLECLALPSPVSLQIQHEGSVRRFGAERQGPPRQPGRPSPTIKSRPNRETHIGEQRPSRTAGPGGLSLSCLGYCTRRDVGLDGKKSEAPPSW